MGTKPETTFHNAVHRHLPRNLHIEKMHNPYRGGTWDHWISGRARDMWIEYKWIGHVPRSAGILPALSPKQRQWGGKRHEEGRTLAVVLGTPDGGVIYTNLDWLVPLDTAAFVERLLPRKTIAAWIEGVTCAGYEPSWRPPLQQQRCTER
jgi:hypothetical protein